MHTLNTHTSPDFLSHFHHKKNLVNHFSIHLHLHLTINNKQLATASVYSLYIVRDPIEPRQFAWVHPIAGFAAKSRPGRDQTINPLVHVRFKLAESIYEARIYDMRLYTIMRSVV